MAFLTVESLLTPTTEEDATQLVIDILESLGFNATSWQSGSVQRTFIQMIGRVFANLTEITAALTSFGFNSTSAEGALTLFSDSNYDNQRFTATNTIGKIQHTTVTGAGPFVVVVGQLVVQVDDGVNLFTYRNITGDTLTDAEPVSLDYQAEEAGRAKNVANNTITKLNTPLVGVSVNNPAIGNTGTWITTPGIDSETDPDLRIRNTTRWSTLTIDIPEDGYIFVVRNSNPAIIRATVISNPNSLPGQADVFVASSTGLVGAVALADAQTALNGRRGVTATVTAKDPLVAGFAFGATIFITASLNTAAEQAAIEQALRDFINSQPIGGTSFALSPGIIPFAIITQTVSDFASVQNINWKAPVEGTDIGVAPTEIVTVSSVAFNFVEV